MDYVIKASYGNDSIALIQWMVEQGHTNAFVLHNDTGWARADWAARVEAGEAFARSVGMEPVRTQAKSGDGLRALAAKLDAATRVPIPWRDVAAERSRRAQSPSIGFVDVVRLKRAFPRSGMQFCTTMLKIEPSLAWLDEVDPAGDMIAVVGIRREESAKRSQWPEWTEDSPLDGGRSLWAPLVHMTAAERDALVVRAGFPVLPHRSKECWPCVHAPRTDLRELAKDPERVTVIRELEAELSEGKAKPRRMFRRQGGIDETIAWAQSAPGKYVEGQESMIDCDAGWCGG
jgi:3'-phosphoadenosine 5'-phosphosulfate sulfotransferase (PAPS reductase)/FAD synthetase